MFYPIKCTCLTLGIYKHLPLARVGLPATRTFFLSAAAKNQRTPTCREIDVMQSPDRNQVRGTTYTSCSTRSTRRTGTVRTAAKPSRPFLHLPPLTMPSVRVPSKLNRRSPGRVVMGAPSLGARCRPPRHRLGASARPRRAANAFYFAHVAAPPPARFSGGEARHRPVPQRALACTLYESSSSRPSSTRRRLLIHRCGSRQASPGRGALQGGGGALRYRGSPPVS